MRTTDLFKNNRAPKKLNEAMEKTFGIKLNLESFTVEQLEDARNKLRTQIYTARNESGFNETVENDTLTQAQWMHDAIVSELMTRNEHIVDNTEVSVEEAAEFDSETVVKILRRFESNMNEIGGYADLDYDKIISTLREGDVEGAVEMISYEIADQEGGEVRGIDVYLEDLYDELDYIVNGDNSEPDDNTDDSYALASAGHGSDEDYGDFDQNESAPQGWEGTVKAMKKHKEIDNPYALAHYMKNKGYKSHKEESVETGDDMTKLHEGEIQQASAIVTAKTMVDRVGRWIEELSGMENDTLLQLGDSIRDEMSQDLAKNFISTVAPAIQQALQNLKDTRETLASGVRTLTGEEQPAEMLGAEPGAMPGAEPGGLEAGPAEPDAMNGDAELDAFAAAEPAVGGDEAAGRAQRESIQYENKLLKVLAG